MGIYKKNRSKILIAALLLFLIALLSIGIGRFSISFSDILDLIIARIRGVADDTLPEYAILFFMRFPRVIAVLIVGAGLSASGAVYQAMFNNPMASSDVLGASQAAGFGAAYAILMGYSSAGITSTAFFLAMAGIFASYFLSTRFKSSRILSLILAGILMGSLFQSGISYIKLIADSENMLPQISFWLMGSFASIRDVDSIYLLLMNILPLIVIFLLRWRINLFSLSSDEAKSIGVNINRMRLILIIATSIIIASTVSAVGIIGWIGLVVPHMARRIVGDDNRYVIPMSMIVGASFLLISDTIARSLSTLELPISIVTSLVGVPIFIILLLSRRKASYGGSYD
ncbi:MAG: iron ABC transporter permease [Firmicutes bacterium]|nr:iron ABC transporter permease [Bacillota bacterium]